MDLTQPTATMMTSGAEEAGTKLVLGTKLVPNVNEATDQHHGQSGPNLAYGGSICSLR